MSRVSFLLSTLSVTIAFSAMLLALGESQVSADVLVNAQCATTPMWGNMTNCACESNVGNANPNGVFACAKSFEFGPLATKYYCLAGTTNICSTGGTPCGDKRSCIPNCSDVDRVCQLTGLNCDNTQTGCFVTN